MPNQKLEPGDLCLVSCNVNPRRTDVNVGKTVYLKRFLPKGKFTKVGRYTYWAEYNDCWLVAGKDLLFNTEYGNTVSLVTGIFAVQELLKITPPDEEQQTVTEREQELVEV